MILRVGACVVMLGILLLIGCGPGHNDVSQKRLEQMSGGKLKDVVPVSGKVQIDGQPGAGVNISLYNSEGTELITQTRTGADGSYCWATYRPCDGLPAGSYKLVFQHIPKPRDNDNVEAEDDSLGGRYADPLTSKHTLSVVSGTPQKDVVYELTTK